MKYTFWLRDALLAPGTAVRDPGGPLVSWKNNLTNLWQLFSENWTPSPYCPQSGHSHIDLWAVLGVMLLTVVGVSRLTGWPLVRIGLWLATIWAALWYSVVLTEVRSCAFLLPLLVFCFAVGREVPWPPRRATECAPYLT